MRKFGQIFHHVLVASFVLALGMCLGGCNLSMFVNQPIVNTPLQDDSFLMAGRISSMDTVTLEVFLVRTPFGDSLLNSTLWEDVDEQIFTATQRREFAANGFRVGLIGNQLPASFLRILKTRDDENPSQIVTTIRLEEMAKAQHLSRKTIASRNGQKNEINVSDIKPQTTVLFNENGSLGGETFYNAQGVMVIRTQTCGDGSVTLELLPEIQYGQPRQTFEYDAGSVTMATARPKRSFDTLRCKLNVRPGQFLVLTSLPDMGGNVGSFFFVNDENNGVGTEQKLLCLRILQTQHNDMYTPDGTLPMDPSESGHVNHLDNMDAKDDSENETEENAENSSEDS